MILPSQKDALHKVWLYRTLTEIADDVFLVQNLAFKGGTCSAMLGILDRFSVDLDFDYVGADKNLPETRTRLEKIFSYLGLTIRDQSKVTPQYFLKYEAKEGERNTMKIDVTFPPPKANEYETKHFSEIDRIFFCQTFETMFANKLVALMERHQKNDSIAGRDVYDIHHFFLNGFRYNEAVIIERTGKTITKFFDDLILFVEKHITDELLSQDLNTLVPYEKFSRTRKTLRQETLTFLRDEKARIKE
jgi:predicted nucleotidyltransferase component of viral defense system